MNTWNIYDKVLSIVLDPNDIDFRKSIDKLRSIYEHTIWRKFITAIDPNILMHTVKYDNSDHEEYLINSILTLDGLTLKDIKLLLKRLKIDQVRTCLSHKDMDVTYTLLQYSEEKNKLYKLFKRYGVVNPVYALKYDMKCQVGCGLNRVHYIETLDLCLNDQPTIIFTNLINFFDFKFNLLKTVLKHGSKCLNSDITYFILFKHSSMDAMTLFDLFRRYKAKLNQSTAINYFNHINWESIENANGILQYLLPQIHYFNAVYSDIAHQLISNTDIYDDLKMRLILRFPKFRSVFSEDILSYFDTRYMHWDIPSYLSLVSHKTLHQLDSHTICTICQYPLAHDDQVVVKTQCITDTIENSCMYHKNCILDGIYSNIFENCPNCRKRLSD